MDPCCSNTTLTHQLFSPSPVNGVNELHKDDSILTTSQSSTTINKPMKKTSSCNNICQSYHEAEQQFQIFVTPRSVTPNVNVSSSSSFNSHSTPKAQLSPCSSYVSHLSTHVEQLSIASSEIAPSGTHGTSSHLASSLTSHPDHIDTHNMAINTSPGALQILTSNQEKRSATLSSNKSINNTSNCDTCDETQHKNQFQLNPTHENFTPIQRPELALQYSAGVQQERDHSSASNCSSPLYQKNKQEPIDFTQGTTELNNDLVISIPDDLFLHENMEYITHLLYAQPTLSLQELVICVSHLLQNGREMADSNLVENALQRYNAESLDYDSFMYVDPELQYTRNLVATDNKHWTLLLLCWNPHSQSPIHNHPQCECYVRVLQNSLVEYRYNHPDGSNSNQTKMVPNTNNTDICSASAVIPRKEYSNEQQLQCISQAECRAGMVTFMNDNIGLHKLKNLTDEHSITLHLYFPPYSSCKIYLNECQVATISNICYHSIQGRLNYFDGLFNDTSSAPVLQVANNTNRENNLGGTTFTAPSSSLETTELCSCPPSCPCPCVRH